MTTETKEAKPKKRRMSLDYAVKYQRRLEGRAVSFANRVHKEEWSWDYLFAVWHGAVCAGQDYERAPRWIKDFMRGWFRCFYEELWQRHTSWFIWDGVQGKHIRTRTHGGNEEPTDWSKVIAEQGASKWLKSGKVFSGYDPTGEAQRIPTSDKLEMMRMTWGER